jgi:hypothetical protein
MLSLYSENPIGSVMINMLVSSVVDRGFEPQSGGSHMWSKNIKLVFVASPLSNIHLYILFCYVFPLKSLLQRKSYTMYYNFHKISSYAVTLMSNGKEKEQTLIGSESE